MVVEFSPIDASFDVDADNMHILPSFQSTRPLLTCLLKPQSPFEDSAGEVFAVAVASSGAFFAFVAVSLEVEVVVHAVVGLGDPSLTCWQRITIRLQYLISLAYPCAVFLCSL